MEKYNKTNIIVLALLYNYIANKETLLKIADVEHFFHELNYELLINKYKIIEETEDLDQKIYQYNKDTKTISFSPDSLNDIKRKYIDILPQEIIEASLASNVITTIKGLIDINDTSICLTPKYVLEKNNDRKQNIKN